MTPRAVLTLVLLVLGFWAATAQTQIRHNGGSDPVYGAVTAATVNTGQGDNELYDMNQNVLTTSSPTFAGITSTGTIGVTGSVTATSTVSSVHLATTGFLVIGDRDTITIDGATTFAMSASRMVLSCTGAETINTITGGSAGTVLILEHEDTDCTLADDDPAVAANAISFEGTAQHLVGAVGRVIILTRNATHWLRVN